MSLTQPSLRRREAPPGVPGLVSDKNSPWRLRRRASRGWEALELEKLQAGRLQELSQQSRWAYEDQAIKVLNSLSSVYTFHMGNGNVKQEPDFKTFVGYNR